MDFQGNSDTSLIYLRRGLILHVELFTRMAV